MTTTRWNDALSEAYFDPANAGGFSSISNLHRSVKKETDIDKKQVKDWLMKQTTYTLHHPARRRFKRNPVVASSIGDVCQADLVDMSAFAGENDGYRFILTFIDVFSKKAFAVPVKTKTAANIKKAFERIFENFIPYQIQTDRGLEFKNKTIMSFMKRNGIHLYFSYNQDIKAAVVERFNRTLKGRMFRFFTHAGSRRYVNVLDRLLDAYNNSYHRSIKMAPNAVPNANPNVVFKNMYKFSDERQLLACQSEEKEKFAIGDTVRLRYHITPMDKGFYPNFTDTTYTVCNIIKEYPRIMYKVKDFTDSVYPRKLYSEDLLKIPANPEYRIEKIIKRRKTRRGVEVFVKFLGYPDSANQWLPLSSVKNVN